MYIIRSEKKCVNKVEQEKLRNLKYNLPSCTLLKLAQNVWEVLHNFGQGLLVRWFSVHRQLWAAATRWELQEEGDWSSTWPQFSAQVCGVFHFLYSWNTKFGLKPAFKNFLPKHFLGLHYSVARKVGSDTIFLAPEWPELPSRLIFCSDATLWATTAKYFRTKNDHTCKTRLSFDSFHDVFEFCHFRTQGFSFTGRSWEASLCQ